MFKRIRDITIVLQNHRGRIFLFTQLEEKKNGKNLLDVYITRMIHKIDIPDEAGFIKDLESSGIVSDNNMCYIAENNKDYEWSLRIAYDDNEIISYGRNAVSESFIRLLTLLGFDSKSYEHDTTSGVPMLESERINSICKIRQQNRMLTELWDEEDSSRRNYIYLEGADGRCKMRRMEGDLRSPILKYEIIVPGGSTELNVWKEKNRLHYSMHHPFKSTDADDSISEISVEEFERKIEEFGKEQDTIPGEHVFDPCFYRLEMIDSSGKWVNYQWCEGDCLSEGLKSFVDYAEKVFEV